ncbi:MAG: EAL domain-containing protein [Rhizobium sp.]|nr:EAL domain-containing protein [Rhizobium sp.]
MTQSANRGGRRDILRQAGLLICLVAMIGLAAALDVFGPLDQRISTWRMATVSRAATGEIVLVEIDKKSLDSVGTWPWNRSIHAQLVDRLVTAEARDIFLDIDFSARSTAEADRTLAAALEAAGGGVILPSFRQYRSASAEDAVVSTTRPNPLFAAHAWIASTSLSADTDGIVRRFPFGEIQDGQFVMSVPALLAGIADQSTTPFQIDFSIDPATMTRISAIDVIEGRADPALLRDKIVVVGASAIELKDNFIVPVHGLVSGPVVHVLASETLLQERRLIVAPLWSVLPGTVLLIACVLFAAHSLRRQTLLLVAGLVALEAGALWLQAAHALILPTGAALTLVASTLAARALEELDLRAWLLRRVSTEANNTRHLLEQVVSDSADIVIIIDDGETIIRHSARLLPLLADLGTAPSNGLAFTSLPLQWQTEVRDALAATAFVSAPSDGASREIHMHGDEGERILDYTITVSDLERNDGRKNGTTKARVVCLTARDVTEKRRQAERIAFMSRHDMLTGALRASALIEDLDALGTVTPSAGEIYAVFAVNLHRFKTINATLGRAKGDALLRAVSQRLGEIAPLLSRPARLGNDSFALYTTHPVSSGEARSLADHIRQRLSVPFELDGTPYRIGASLGMTIADRLVQGRGAERIAEAELALDEARRGTGDDIVEFDPESGVRHAEARLLESELWHALDRGQMKLLYQPQVTLSNRAIIGAEALIRWQHPQRGMVSPLAFIGIAEANGFIVELGAWALRQACRDAAAWPDDVVVAVNVAPLQLQRRTLVDDVQVALAESGLPARRLHLEITESSFISAADELIETLQRLKAIGVGLALDDFGSGYSSLGYLARFPLDKIKVDQMFIRSLTESAASEAIVSSVQALSTGLGMTMLCEGIETEAQANHLLQLGCSQGQGYLFGKPQPAASLDALARQSPVRRRAAG